MGLEPVETASSTPTPDASILQITILDAREYNIASRQPIQPQQPL
ncbi:Unannotated [Lentimonas sp. CC11]|nr:Unannotated [Lentimonas sp. CC11]